VRFEENETATAKHNSICGRIPVLSNIEPESLLMKESNPVIVTSPVSKAIIYSWQTPILLVLMMGGVFLGITVLYYIISSRLTPISLVLAVLLSIYCYFVTAYAVNKTTIEADESTLSIRRGPIPWPGKHKFSIQDIASLYCEHINYGKHTTYSLRVILRSGEGVTLLSLDNAQQAQSMVREIETWLGFQQATENLS